MDCIDQIKALGGVIPKKLEDCKTEEASKHALVMPFIQALGYNVFDPGEVMPEFSADFGTKIASKCDYVICRDRQPCMLIECKWSGRNLEKKDEDQLRQYFAACTSAKIGILTNGLLYKFFTDIDKIHVMDEKPFFEFDIRNDAKPVKVEELKRFTKLGYDPEELAKAATELKYTSEIKRIFAEQFDEPADEFTKFFASQVHAGRKVTTAVLKKFTDLTRDAMKQYVNDLINARLKKAMDESSSPAPVHEQPMDDSPVPSPTELEGFHLVRGLLCSNVALDRITMEKKKGKDYLNIRLDGSKKRPVCRLYLNKEDKYLGLWEETAPGEGRAQNMVEISGLNDIYGFADRLRAIVDYQQARYGGPKPDGNETEDANGD